MSLQNYLIVELIRFSIYLNDEWRIKLEDAKRTLDEDELAYRICIRTLLYPSGISEKALEEFFRILPFKRFLDAINRGVDAYNVAISSATIVENFRPIPPGFSAFAQFMKQLADLAIQKGEGSLIKAFRKIIQNALKEKEAETLLKEFMKLRGIGPTLAPCLIRDLRLAGLIDIDISLVDISTAKPVLRALKHIGLISSNLEGREAEETAKTEIRKISKKYRIAPMVLDGGLWHIGYYYCKKRLCDICPLTYVCPKIET